MPEHLQKTKSPMLQESTKHIIPWNVVNVICKVKDEIYADAKLLAPFYWRII